MQCALASLFGLNGMTSVFDILIKISLFTLILDTLPNIFDGIDCKLVRTSEFECNSGDDNDGIVIASNIYQSKSAGVGVGFFLAAIYSIRQVIVGLSLIIAVTGIAAFSDLIAGLQLNLNVELMFGIICYCYKLSRNLHAAVLDALRMCKDILCFPFLFFCLKNCFCQ